MPGLACNVIHRTILLVSIPNCEPTPEEWRAQQDFFAAEAPNARFAIVLPSGTPPNAKARERFERAHIVNPKLRSVFVVSQAITNLFLETILAWSVGERIGSAPSLGKALEK